jgi:hypothetical protein
MYVASGASVVRLQVQAAELRLDEGKPVVVAACSSRRGRRQNVRRGWWWRGAPLGSSQRRGDTGVE